MGIRLPYDDGALGRGIADLLAAESLAGTGADGRAPGDASLRITVSRGPLERRGLLPPADDVPPTVAIQAWPYAPPPDELLERGVRGDPEHGPARPGFAARRGQVHLPR